MATKLQRLIDLGLDARLRIGDKRLHRHRLNDAHILIGNHRARHHRFTRNPVKLPGHLCPVVHSIADDNARQPLAAHRSRPARTQHANWIAVQFRQQLAIHRPDNHGFLFEGLLQRHTARNRFFRRVTGQMCIGRRVSDVNGIVADATGFEYIPHSHPGPFRTTDGTGGPLVTFRRWIKLGTPVAAAFDLQLQRVVFEALLKLAERHRSGTFARFSLNTDLPGQRIDIPGHWRHTIVADKQSCRRRYRVIKQVSGCLCVYGPVVENDQTRFTRYRKKLVTLRQRRGYQATGHVFCERDTRPEHRAHHRKT